MDSEKFQKRINKKGSNVSHGFSIECDDNPLFDFRKNHNIIYIRMTRNN